LKSRDLKRKPQRTVTLSCQVLLSGSASVRQSARKGTEKVPKASQRRWGKTGKGGVFRVQWVRTRAEGVFQEGGKAKIKGQSL